MASLVAQAEDSCIVLISHLANHHLLRFFVRHCVQKMLVTTLSQYPLDPPTEDQFVPEFLRDRDSDSDSDDASASDISA